MRVVRSSGPGSPEIPASLSVVSLYIYRRGMYLHFNLEFPGSVLGLLDSARIFTHFAFWQCSKLCPILLQTLLLFCSIITDNS